jgi:peptide deformylase
MIRKVLTYPNEELRKVSEEITDNDYVFELVHDMVQTMYANNGIGLAAPQIGVHKRIIIINQTPNNKNSIIVMLNPVIIQGKDKTKSPEGCLSVPGYNNLVIRQRRIIVEYKDYISKEVHTLTATKSLGCIIQHEIDHLNGKLFIDRLKEKDRILFDKVYGSC